MRPCLVAELVLRVISIFFIVAGFLLYEREEKKIGDLLMRWWVRIDDMRGISGSKSLGFVRGVSQMISRGFDLLLGEKLFSVRAIGVSFGSSLCFTFASFFLFGALADFSNRVHHQAGGSVTWDALVALAFAFAGIVPAFFQKRWELFVWFACIALSLRLVFYVGYIVFRMRGMVSTLHYFRFIGLAILFSYSCDALYLVATRIMLRKIENGRLLGILGMILGNLTLCLAFVFGPVLIAVKLLERYSDSALSLTFAGLIIASPAINAIDILASALGFVLSAFILCYRFVFWPLVGRPIYSLARLSLVERRALLWAIGVCLWENHFVLDRFCRSK